MRRYCRKLSGHKLFLVSVTVFFTMLMTMVIVKRNETIYEEFKYKTAEIRRRFQVSLLLNSTGDSPKNIYFLETSESSTLNAKQACSVESAARMNPSMTVYVVINGKSKAERSAWMSALEKLENVVIKERTLEESFLNTPLEDWYLRGDWKSSPYRVAHLSDALRLVVIWQQGGIYLDLDVLVLRSLHPLKSTVIAENSDSLANGVFSFDKHSAYLFECILDFHENYSSRDWSSNGPALLTRNFKRMCNTEHILTDHSLPCGVTVLPPTAAYPIPWKEWSRYFNYVPPYNISEYFSDSYVVHLWNNLSRDASPTNGSFYDLLMKAKCPSVIKAIQ